MKLTRHHTREAHQAAEAPAADPGMQAPSMATQGTSMSVVSGARDAKPCDHPVVNLGVEAQLPLAATQANLERAKAVALEGWRGRARERGREELPEDLGGACKFASMFAQRLFGGELRGNHDHQFLLLEGVIIDLTEGSEELARLRAEGKDPYLHDRRFWGNREHRESMRSCEGRVNDWVERFLSASPAPSIGMEKVHAFHASPVEGIEAFEPLSHFGSRAAAERRAEKHLRDGAKITLYAVDLDIRNPLRIPDLPASHKRTGLHSAFRIAEQLYYEVKPGVLTDAERTAVIKACESGSERDCLISILESKGYDGLVYANGWEDPGSLSWVIFRPEQVKILPCR